MQGNDATYDIQAANEGATAGNARGENSVDLQTVRSVATEIASGIQSTLSGGNQNTASGYRSTTSGGFNNDSIASYTTVGGGSGNIASNLYSTVSGGSGNGASGTYSTIGGGFNNNSIASYTTVGGGSTNIASNLYSTVGGGNSNDASGTYSTIGGGYNNTALGQYSTIGGGRDNDASGNYSVAAGRQAKTGANNGSFRFADSNNTDFIAGQGANTFGCRFSGGYNFYSDSVATVGVTLAASGTAWGVLSDRNAKENFEQVDTAEVLNKVKELPITTWNLKAQDANIRHMGPMAQDFHAAFGLAGDVDTRIETGDSDGVLYAAIKGLLDKVNQLESRILELESN